MLARGPNRPPAREKSVTAMATTATAAALLLAAMAAAPAARAAPIELEVDASRISQRIVTVHEELAVQPGPLTLVYPKWIPGDHAPTGPIADLTGTTFSANGTTLAWRRDGVDMYAYHLVVPAGAARLTVRFTKVGAYAPGDDFNLGNTSTPTQGDVTFNQFILYPAGAASDAVQVRTAVTLPAGWDFATALPTVRRDGTRAQFDVVDLTTLVDSPVMMGAHARHYDVTPAGEARRHVLSIFGETVAGTDLPAARVDAFRRLVAEAGALFGAHHYAHFDFLVEAHGDASDGVEHHQSNDNQLPRLGMTDPNFAAESGYQLAHEFVHSWNGKYRRPAGLATANFQEPMVGDLLWVYEGLTSYYGEVLAARAGLETAAQWRDRLARDYAQMDHRAGRAWRPLQDTATAAQLLYSASDRWESQRRSTDYYVEGILLWLDVDAAIRTTSGGRRTLDDFARTFFGAPDSGSTVVPYTFADVVQALDAVAPNDWAGFLRARLDAVRPAPPAQGLQAAGWQVVYSAEPNLATAAAEANSRQLDLRDSLGIVVDRNGVIVDVQPDSPAGRAGIVPATKLVAVDRRTYAPDELRELLAAAVTTSAPLELMTVDNDVFQSVEVDYHGGERYAHLERIAGVPDLLTPIARPRTR